MISLLLVVVGMILWIVSIAFFYSFFNSDGKAAGGLALSGGWGKDEAPRHLGGSIVFRRLFLYAVGADRTVLKGCPGSSGFSTEQMNGKRPENGRYCDGN